MHVAQQGGRIVEASRRQRNLRLPARCSLGHTLLHHALNAIELHTRDNGADIDALSFGWSAMHAAVAMPDADMAELLIRHGADPYVKADLRSPVGPEHNHPTPMDLLAGFRRSAELLRLSTSY